MILKNNIDFLTFNDGVAKIYETDENDDIIADSLKKYRFGNEKIGVTRFYGAKQNDIELSKVIHIHKDENLRTDMAVVISGTRFKIEQIQHDKSKNPPCSIVSLSQRGLYEGGAEDVF